MFHLRALICCAMCLLCCHGVRGTDTAAPQAVRTLGAIDPAAQAPGAPPGAMPPPPLAVVSYGPTGRTDGGGTIHVRFNQPVAALGDSQAAAADLLRIVPPVAGRVSFDSPELLVLAPDKLAEAQQYQVTLRTPLSALSGARYAGPLSFTFETPRPRVVSAYPEPGSEDQRRDTPIILQLSQSSTTDEVRAHLHARAVPLPAPGTPESQAQAQPRDLEVRVAPSTAAEIKQRGQWALEGLAAGRVFTVTSAGPAGLWPVGHEIAVEVTPGLRCSAGPLQMEEPYRTTLRTYQQLRVASAPCVPPQGCGLEPLTLRFNNPITKKQLGKLRLLPRPRDLSIELLDSWDDKEGGKEVTITGVFLPAPPMTSGSTAA